MVDNTGEVAHILLNTNVSVPKAHAETVCHAKQAATVGCDKVCRYVGETPNGFVCAKNTKLKDLIDQLVASGKYTRATGDNCGGFHP